MTKSTKGSTKVGSEVLAYCTKCRMDLAATILNMKGDKIGKVKCRTCESDRVFRTPKGITEPAKKKTRKKKAPASAPVEVEWKRLMAAKKDDPMKSYHTKKGFILGDKISHTTFGEGVVDRLIFPNKIQVVFKDDIKVLIHGPK